MALPLAIASARRRLCQRCPHYCHRAGWRWYRCTQGITSIQEEGNAPECGDDWWQGQNSLCAIGLWDKAISVLDDRVGVELDAEDVDIGPTDDAAFRDELASKAEEEEKAALAGSFFVKLLSEVPQERAVELILAAVTEGQMTAKTGELLAEAGGLEIDEDITGTDKGG